MVEINLSSDNKTKKVKKKRKHSKFAKLGWAILYFSLTLTLCLSGTWAFVRYYYFPIYVSGKSMEPTLNGGSYSNGYRYDFGYIDTHSTAIDRIDRFDIVTTFFPFSAEDYVLPYQKGATTRPNAKHKIKRVMAIPGDTFTISNNVLIFRDLETNVDTPVDLPFDVISSDVGESGIYNPVDFKTKGYGDEEGFVTLKEDEYWVMGDNWLESRDSYSDQIGGPVYKENIVGVLIAIIGTCLVKDELIYDKKFSVPTFYK